MLDILNKKWGFLFSLSPLSINVGKIEWFLLLVRRLFHCTLVNMNTDSMIDPYLQENLSGIVENFTVFNSECGILPNLEKLRVSDNIFAATKITLN